MSLILANPVGPAAGGFSTEGHSHAQVSIRSIVLATALAAGAVLLFTDNQWWRRLEVDVSSWLMSLWSGQNTHAYPAADIVVLYHGRQPQIAFDVTAECSVGYIVGVIMFFASILVLVPRLRTARTLEALGAAALILLVTNLGRIAFLGVAVAHLGVIQGLVFGHVYLGSIVTLVGAALSGIAFVSIIGLAVRADMRSK